MWFWRNKVETHDPTRITIDGKTNAVKFGAAASRGCVRNYVGKLIFRNKLIFRKHLTYLNCVFLDKSSLKKQNFKVDFPINGLLYFYLGHTVRPSDRLWHLESRLNLGCPSCFQDECSFSVRFLYVVPDTATTGSSSEIDSHRPLNLPIYSYLCPDPSVGFDHDHL